MFYFSKSTAGFYTPKVHKAMPEDVVEVTVEEYQALIEAQAVGKAIASDVGGKPRAVDRPPEALRPVKPTRVQLEDELIKADFSAKQAKAILDILAFR